MLLKNQHQKLLWLLTWQPFSPGLLDQFQILGSLISHSLAMSVKDFFLKKSLFYIVLTAFF